MAAGDYLRISSRCCSGCAWRRGISRGMYVGAVLGVSRRIGPSMARMAIGWWE